MLGALLADRPQEEPEESAPASRSEDEELGAAARLEEHLSGRPGDGFGLDLHAVERLPVYALNHSLHQRTRLGLDGRPEPLDIAQGEDRGAGQPGRRGAGIRESHGGRLVRVEDSQLRATQPGLVERPA